MKYAYSGISGKRILITGSTSGLGLAMAKALLREGAHAMVTGRDPSNVDQVVSRLSNGAGQVLGTALDVRDESSIEDGLGKMVGAWGGVDVLINNAGMGMRTVNSKFLTEPQPFWDVPSDKFRDLIETNLTGYFLVAKKITPHFLRQGTGRIVNISVSHETMTRKGFVPYGPSRAATESLSHIMAQDLASTDITVNLLLPGGATDTGMIPQEFPDSMRARLLSPDVMEEPVLFLCSDQGKAIHDERIVAKDFAQWKASKGIS